MSRRTYFLCMMLLLSMPSGATPSGSAAFGSAADEEAFAKAQERSSTDAGNPDFDFLYGTLARKVGRPEIAVLPLERVVLRNPNDVIATYELGLALLETKDLISARKTFERVLEIATDSTLKTNAIQLLDLIDRRQNAKKSATEVWLDSIVDVGFNSNVNTGSTDTGEFLTQGPVVEDGFVNLAGSFLFQRYYSKKAALFASLSTDNRKNLQSLDWDSNVFGARMGGEFALGQFEWRIPVDFEVLLFDYTFARFIATVSLDTSYNWNDFNQTSLSVRAQPKFYQSGVNNHFSLPVVLSHQYKNESRGFQIDAAIGYARGFAYIDNPGPFVNSYLDAGVALSWGFADSHFLLGSVKFKSWEFPLTSNPSGPRRDQSFAAKLGYEWKFTRNWSLLPMFLYTYNTSTDAGQSYSSYQAQLGLRYQL